MCVDDKEQERQGGGRGGGADGVQTVFRLDQVPVTVN